MSSAGGPAAASAPGTQDPGRNADSQAPELPCLDSVPPGEVGEPLVQRRVSGRNGDGRLQQRGFVATCVRQREAPLTLAAPSLCHPWDLRRVPAAPEKGGVCGFVLSASQALVLHGVGSFCLPCRKRHPAKWMYLWQCHLLEAGTFHLLMRGPPQPQHAIPERRLTAPPRC